MLRWPVMDACMEDIPHTSSMECVNALWRLGFSLADVNDHRVSMVRADGRRVFVERHKLLSPQAIRVILLVADVKVPEFIAALGSHESREFGAPEADSGIRSKAGTLPNRLAAAA